MLAGAPGRTLKTITPKDAEDPASAMVVGEHAWRVRYDAVIYAVGAQSDRMLNIPGEDLLAVSRRRFLRRLVQRNNRYSIQMGRGNGNVALDVALDSAHRSRRWHAPISPITLGIHAHAVIQEVIVMPSPLQVASTRWSCASWPTPTAPLTW